MRLLVIISLLSIAYAQFQALPEGVTPKPWKGPLADHQLGVHPGDTPEVTAAKTQHLTAYREVLSVLPELPPEERYIMDESPLPAVQKARDQFTAFHVRQPPVITTQAPPVQHFFPVLPQIPPPDRTVKTVTTPRFTKFAEEIPRSPIGEVPEVHAARIAHLKAIKEARDASREV